MQMIMYTHYLYVWWDMTYVRCWLWGSGRSCWRRQDVVIFLFFSSCGDKWCSYIMSK